MKVRKSLDENQGHLADNNTNCKLDKEQGGYWGNNWPQ